MSYSIYFVEGIFYWHNLGLVIPDVLKFSFSLWVVVLGMVISAKKLSTFSLVSCG